jgi:hypothetical protein
MKLKKNVKLEKKYRLIVAINYIYIQPQNVK